MHQHQINPKAHLLTDDQQAVVALCTPRGSGAIGLIRISGVNAVNVACHLAKLSSGDVLSAVSSHTIHHGYVVGPTVGQSQSSPASEIIDEVLFLLMRGPRTFTGQDTVEITCHNNQFIIQRIIDLAVEYGARHARAGEFTKRAFLGGKIDLLQAESINDLIHAQTELALRQSMSQLHGSLSQSLANIEKQIVGLLGYVEASFEFLDEEQRDLDFDQAIKDRTYDLLRQIAEIKAHFAQQQQIKEGVRIALLGIVNAGKSTLFNAILKKERAIVTDIEGTTRDSIETNIYRNGNFWLLIDTAGIRQTDDIIEQKGIERSFSEAAASDIVLLVIDATRPLTPLQYQQYVAIVAQYSEKILVVINKVDELAGSYQHSATLSFLSNLPTIALSAKNKKGVDSLEEAIEKKIQQLFAQLNSPFLLNQRQFKLLTEIEVGLENIANSYSDGIHYELIAYQLKDLLEKVSELTGKNISEHVMDMIFNEFCIGK